MFGSEEEDLTLALRESLEQEQLYQAKRNFMKQAHENSLKSTMVDSNNNNNFNSSNINASQIVPQHQPSQILYQDDQIPSQTDTKLSIIQNQILQENHFQPQSNSQQPPTQFYPLEHDITQIQIPEDCLFANYFQASWNHFLNVSSQTNFMMENINQRLQKLEEITTSLSQIQSKQNLNNQTKK